MGGLKDFQQWLVRLHRNSISTQIRVYVRHAGVQQNDEMLQLQRLMSSFLSLFYMPYIQCVCVCVCYLFVYVYVCVYMCVCVYVYVCMCTLCVRMCVCVYVYVCVCYLCVYVYVCVYMCMCVLCVCVCVCVEFHGKKMAPFF